MKQFDYIRFLSLKWLAHIFIANHFHICTFRQCQLIIPDQEQFDEEVGGDDPDGDPTRRNAKHGRNHVYLILTTVNSNFR